MSFFYTQAQMRARTKRVTRRMGWRFLKRGDRLRAVEKAQGLKKGEKQVPICTIEVVSVMRVNLDSISPEDVVLEGFPGMRRADFVRFFMAANGLEDPATPVTRVAFRHLD